VFNLTVSDRRSLVPDEARIAAAMRGNLVAQTAGSRRAELVICAHRRSWLPSPPVRLTRWGADSLSENRR